MTGTDSTDLFVVRARVADAARPDLFAEAPGPWYLQTDAGTPAGDGRVTFRLRVLAGPRTPSPLAVRLTLVAGSRAVEVTTQLDGAASKL